MEMSHRGKDFVSIAEKAEADLRELLAVPGDYKVLFLPGGATAQFAAVPMNLRRGKAKVSYVSTGYWSGKAIAEATLYGQVQVAASAKDSNFTTIPPVSRWNVDPDAAYLHYTANETIGGVEFHAAPEVDGFPLVADMSSNILSRPVDVRRFGLIYGSAQKNIGVAGITVVIVREDLIGQARAGTPSVWNYQAVADDGSMLNTPPTFAWYFAGLVFKWLKRHGGLAAMAERNRAKAQLLYATIDQSGFYRNPVDPACRSWMNVPFILPDAALDKAFLAGADSAGLMNLKGHRLVGGMRASLYNATSIEAVRALSEFMLEFARRHG